MPHPRNSHCAALPPKTDQDVLFEAGTFNVQSRHHNFIAFSVDATLLLKVLKSASGNDTERLDVKLVQKPVRMPGQEEPEQCPFMSFTARVRGLLCDAQSICHIWT